MCVAVGWSGAGYAQPARAVVRDSAGVRVVSYAATSPPPGVWRVEATSPGNSQHLRSSRGEADEELADVVGVVRLSDGRLAVANRGTQQILVFTPDGRLQHRLGRRGQGPFEFSNLSRLLRISDTLVGVDGDSRAHVFAPGGPGIRSLAVIRVPNGRNPRRLLVDAGGSGLVSYYRGAPRNEATEAWIDVGVARVDGATGTVREILSLPGYRTASQGRPAGPLLLGARGGVAVSADRICTGVSQRYELSCFDAAGRLRTKTMLPVTPRATTDGDRTVVGDAYLAANADAPPAVRAQMRDAVRSFPFAATVPVFGKLLLSSTGELWVADFDPAMELPGSLETQAPAGAHRWRVFAGDGTWLSEVTLPAGFVLWEIGSDYVAGVSHDADGGERITVLTLVRG